MVINIDNEIHGKIKIEADDPLEVRAYHTKKNEYILELCFNKTKIRFWFTTKWRLERFAGANNFTEMYYFSSNGKIIHKRLKVSKIEKTFFGKTEVEYDYKYVKVKEYDATL